MKKVYLQQNQNTSEHCISYDVMLDAEIIGMCQLRSIARKSVTLPEGFESHIYYEINPEYQGKGYATEVLKLLLDEARAIQLDKVLLSVATANIPSVRVIEKNGGELIKTGLTTNNEDYKLYQINL